MQQQQVRSEFVRQRLEDLVRREHESQFRFEKEQVSGHHSSAVEIANHVK